MSKKIKQTTRKFYNKWSYKVSFNLKGITALRVLSFEEVSQKSISEDLRLFVEELAKLDTSLYSKRLENQIIDIYTNDAVIFQNLHDKFNHCVRHAFAPSGQELIADGNFIVAKKLPHDRYQYKVFLQPHKISNPEEKLNFLNWLDTQVPRVSITKTVKTWFYKTHWNWDRRYMYVEDEKTLLLIKLKCSEAMGTIYSYQVSDK
jgi:hypothetical protein